jgi:hypothetical protein
VIYSNQRRKLSETTKVKIGLSNSGPKPDRFKKRLEIRCANTNCTNTWLSLESQTQKKYCSRKCRNIVLKNVLSEHMKNSYKTGKINNSGRNNRAFGKPPVYKSYDRNGILMKSSWEVAFADWLDKNKKNWKYESLTFDLGNCTYTPDFCIFNNQNKLEEIIEVKGYENKYYVKKFKLFESMYPNMRMITKVLKFNDLLEMKILGGS